MSQVRCFPLRKVLVPMRDLLVKFGQLGSHFLDQECNFALSQRWPQEPRKASQVRLRKLSYPASNLGILLGTCKAALVRSAYGPLPVV